MEYMSKARELINEWRAKWSKPVPRGTGAYRTTPEYPGRYLHVSKPITASVRLATQLELHGVAATLLMQERGVTYRSPRGVIRQQADSMAEELGLNNKQRRNLRSRMRRIHAERAT